MSDDPPFRPDGELREVSGAWWLELRCACGRTAQVPNKLLARRHGARARVPELLARMRCEQCRARPASAEWIDNPAGGARGSGYPPPKRIPLALPPP